MVFFQFASKLKAGDMLEVGTPEVYFALMQIIKLRRLCIW
jgi:hypothetical protein